MRQYKAKQNDEGMRLSRFVARVAPGLREGAMHKAFRNKRVKVNGRRAAAEYRLQPGDLVELYINDEYFAEGASSSALPRPRVPFTIEWQNQSLAVLYKPAGVLCHSDNTRDGDLATSFAAGLRKTGEWDPAGANGFTPALCNRLDRGTEGLVLAAKRYAALRDMNQAIRRGLVHKTYLCIVVGTPQEGRHEAFLLRDKQAKTSRVLSVERPGAKPIATGVRVLETSGSLCLCEVALYTGRTHQIRAHLAFLGAPLLGDKRYGGEAARPQGPHLRSQALCAYSLAFDNEMTDYADLKALAGQTVTATNATLPGLWRSLQGGRA